MAAQRAFCSIAPELKRKFNEPVPTGERSRVIQSLMRQVLAQRERRLEALADEFETHPDFAQARSDSEAFDAATSDGLDD